MFENILFFNVKVIITVILLVLTLFFTFLPWIIRSRIKKSNTLLSLITCLAGGVILGSLLFHLIPETLSIHSDHFNHGSLGRSPEWAFSSKDNEHSCSYHDHHHHHHDHDHEHNYNHHCSHHPFSYPNSYQYNQPLPNSYQNYQPIPIESQVPYSTCTQFSSSTQAQNLASNVNINQYIENKRFDNHILEQREAKINQGDQDQEHHHSSYQWGSLSIGLSFFLLLAIDRLYLAHRHCHNKQSDIEPIEDDNCHAVSALGGCHVDGINQSSTKAQAYVFVIALSIHSFFEGLAMNSISTGSQIISFTASLMLHKCLEALALGVTVFKASFSPFHSIFLGFFYSILTPLGIVLSFMLGSSDAFLVQILNGLAAGSFLFVALLELIVPEFHTYERSTVFKFIFVLIGFSLMASLSIIPDFHSH